MIVYTLFAQLKGEDSGVWMIAAEDEFSWEGDPDRCEAVFRDARHRADKNGWEVREIEVSLPYDQIDAAFASPSIVGEVSQP